MNIWTKITPKGYFLSKKEKNENYNQISHIQNNLGSEFQLQQTIFIFWNKFPQERLHPVENRKNEHHH